MQTFTGTYQGVYPILPYGTLRDLVINTKDGKQNIHVHFKRIEEQTKGLKKGDRVELRFIDYDTFTITRL